MNKVTFFTCFYFLLIWSNGSAQQNPVFPGWYADPEGIIYDNTYWIFPTYSAPYEEQVFFDAFSSKDLVTWQKHHRIIDTSEVKWANKAMWAPGIIEKDGKYYFFFEIGRASCRERV